jgi:hypothetical protein
MRCGIVGERDIARGDSIPRLDQSASLTLSGEDAYREQKGAYTCTERHFSGWLTRDLAPIENGADGDTMKKRISECELLNRRASLSCVEDDRI